MTKYYSKYAGSAAPGYSPEALCRFCTPVDFAALRTATGATGADHTTGVVNTDDIVVATLPKGSTLISLGLYTETAIGAQTIDLTDGTTTFLSNASGAVADTWDYPDTNPMAAVNYGDDTELYLNADGTITAGKVWVFGLFYMNVPEASIA